MFDCLNPKGGEICGDEEKGSGEEEGCCQEKEVRNFPIE
jgi:hypothetical protein